MQKTVLFVTLGVLAVVIVALILLTAQLTPENTNPAYAVAVTFVEAAARGDDASAAPLLSAELSAYVAANCRDGSVSACIQGYTPAEWGGLVHAEFRRADTTGRDIQLVATYQEGVGFSGVCIYVRVEALDEASSDYRVTRWGGFIHCGDPLARFDPLVNDPAVPNRAP